VKPTIFLRFDVEDWLTPAADWALVRILDQLAEVGARANFAVVGLKAAALLGRGRADVLRRLAALGSVGYHSYSHSVHPTLAEDLNPLDDEQALQRFVEREAPGVAILRRAGTPPVFFTQPGANWVPEVAQVGPDLGLRAFVSEAWNSYLVPSRRLCWLGRVLYWAPPVDVPKGFVFGLPDGVADAVESVQATVDRGEPAMVVTHPTELTTARFWDQDNFAAGENHWPTVPGAALPAAAWEARARALGDYWKRLADLDPVWVTVDDWLAAVDPPGAVPVDRATLAEALRRDGLGPLRVTGGVLSAAEVVYAVAALADGSGPVTVPWLDVPRGDLTAPTPEALCEAALAGGRLPWRWGGRSLLEGALALAEQVLGVRPVPRVSGRVRPPAEQHWDWPIFAPGFRADRIWERAVRAAWALKPAAVRPGHWLDASAFGVHDRP
jgi:peptidoglycan/xylan/chitin deacetylase (PgdA/CDA1 family)